MMRARPRRFCHYGVDPDDGSIKDPNTNQYVGISYRYLNNTICKVPEHSDD